MEKGFAMLILLYCTGSNTYAIRLIGASNGPGEHGASVWIHKCMRAQESGNMAPVGNVLLLYVRVGQGRKAGKWAGGVEDGLYLLPLRTPAAVPSTVEANGLPSILKVEFLSFVESNPRTM